MDWYILTYLEKTEVNNVCNSLKLLTRYWRINLWVVWFDYASV